MKILKKKKLYIANSDDDIYIHIKYKENRFIIENLLKKKKKIFIHTRIHGLYISMKIINGTIKTQ